MNLSKNHLKLINTTTGIDLPGESIHQLPEKVLQFGTGVLLRGLPDYFIDKANKQGVFNGRIVVVKSTSQGSGDAFEKQDGLYTLCVRGYDNGTVVNKYILNASISRVLAANESWDAILECAANPLMEIVISNTTEAGLVLTDDDVHARPPVSFPGKLLAFLYKRFQIFNGDIKAGMVILPTELITDNGLKLKEILLELCKRNNLEESFVNWLTEANDFCNTLVDRIVPGALSAKDKADAEKHLGFNDDLMIMSEVYSLWAIETDSERAKEKLSFSASDAGVVITPDVSKFKELKLRLLNGSHTFSCGLAVLKGFNTVKEAMENETFYSFISELMFREIVPAMLTDSITEQDAKAFATNVLDRYRNPFIEHKWLSITLQYTMKMKSRNVSSIVWYFEKFGRAPLHMATGFAAYILFMRSDLNDAGNYTGRLNNKEYIINDQFASSLHLKWQQYTGIELVESVLSDESLWGVSLAALPGFSEAVYNSMMALQDQTVTSVPL